MLLDSVRTNARANNVIQVLRINPSGREPPALVCSTDGWLFDIVRSGMSDSLKPRMRDERR
ncbi:hypothetical protein ALP98_200055 [Pseudomonas viridiflava]|uniref:Uncharacterized protein n=1 Tax=Pseudomonas viridiflava TaxID=33069 RepID=A0A3M4NXM1_PSEVI|nr:hypothetical protein ALP98_200055 [Pseudomonas viridiflava]